MENLIKIQAELKAPKNQLNKFGNYKYRSCEDILEALKPLLLKYNCELTISDEVEMLGSIPLIKSTVIIFDGTLNVKTTAYAGIDPTKKGMDIAQCFGSSSSYARKYALNGLFLIDDTKDADATNTNGKDDKPFDNSTELVNAIKEINDSKGLEDLQIIWMKYKSLQTAEIFIKAKDAKKAKFISGGK